MILLNFEHTKGQSGTIRTKLINDNEEPATIHTRSQFIDISIII